MQKDRKAKLDEAFMARRRRQLAYCLASTLGVVVSTSLSTMSTMAFDMPPVSQPKSVYMGPIGVGPESSKNVDHSNVDRGQVSSSDALKRVGIRFVGPESTVKQSNFASESRTAGQPLPQTREAIQPPKVVQPPMVISSPGTLPNHSGANESSIVGIRIRIPADKPINTTLPSTIASSASSSEPTQASTPASTLATAGPTSLKMTVGTGVATESTNAANAANVTMASVSNAIPTFSALPTIDAPKLPSVESKSNETVAAQPISGSKLQAKLQDRSTMTSRAPGIVRLPSIVVWEVSNEPVQARPMAARTPSLAQTANRSIELADSKLGSSEFSTVPRLTDATARAVARHEPSIIPVALVSTALQDASASNVAAGFDESVERSTQQNVGPTAVSATDTINVPLKSVQSMRFPGKVSQVLIEDDTVCRIISTEPNTLTIIGASIGDSKITVWSANPLTKADESQIFKISVRETWGQAAKNTVSIDDVNQSIAALFPGSTVVIKPNSDGSISVQGNATSNESAKQILMLVRKMFLVPVQDRIAIAKL